MSDETSVSAWQDEFDQRFNNNFVYWQELAAEIHIGDPDFNSVRDFIRDLLVEKDAEIEEAKANYLRACQTVALMHAAAMGEVCGSKRGVVEDVEDLLTWARKAYKLFGNLGALSVVDTLDVVVIRRDAPDGVKGEV